MPVPRRIAAVIVSAVVSLGVPAVATAAAPVAPDSGLLFGASVATAAGSTAAQSMAAEEARLGRTMAVDRTYSRWDDAQPSPIVRDDGERGRTPLLSIRAQRKDGTVVPWASIAAGTEDAQIRAQADGLRDSGIPVVLAFHHEPEYSGTAFGTAADYVAAFRHYVAVFRAESASNVAFAIVLGASTYTNPSAWYPGDDVVDWIGADAYNFAACAPNLPAWRSFATTASAFYAWGSAKGKPLVVAEWGSAEDPNQPGRKAQWITDAGATLASWPAVKATAYFDRVGSCDWRLSTSASALTAFTDLGHTAYANGAPTARITAAVPVGPAPLSETFDLSTSTGGGSTTGSGVASWSLDFGDGTSAQGAGQPGTVSHVYAGGHWTATLTVTDTSGTSARCLVRVISAPPPTVSEGTPTVTSTSAVVPAWIYTSALSGSYVVQWGRSTSYGSKVGPVGLPALDWTQAVTATLSGLHPATRYHWRVVATTAAGTTYGPDRWFTTAAG